MNYLPEDTAVADGWISCQNKLPAPEQWVLVYRGDGDMKVCFLSQRMEWDDGDFYHDVLGVTHWMPLPRVPRESTNEPWQHWAKED